MNLDAPHGQATITIKRRIALDDNGAWQYVQSATDIGDIYLDDTAEVDIVIRLPNGPMIIPFQRLDPMSPYDFVEYMQRRNEGWNPSLNQAIPDQKSSS